MTVSSFPQSFKNTIISFLDVFVLPFELMDIIKSKERKKMSDYNEEYSMWG